MTDTRTVAETALRASLTADSLALAAHWIYDAEAIRQRFGRVDTLMAPGPDSFHKNRKAGQFTHYGDQTRVLLESLAAQGGFDQDDFLGRWKLLFSDYDGYVDGATRQTMEHMGAGWTPAQGGSGSNDLAGAARIAPLLLLRRDDVAALAAEARAQTRLTHNYPLVLDAAEFFARAGHAALHGAPLLDALRRAAEASYVALPARDWLEQGLEFAAAETVDAVTHFGQSCHVDGAFRSTIQIVARHQRDPAEGLVQNVMAGGDSAARGLLAGMLLYAASPPETGPKAHLATWWRSLADHAALDGLVARIP